MLLNGFAGALFVALSMISGMDLQIADSAMQGDIGRLRALLSEDPDVNRAQGDGMTALHWAAFRDDVEMARLLIEAGADIHAVTRVGDITPLILAARNGSAPLIRELLKAGADANSTTATGATVLMSAALSGSVDAVRILLDHGAAVNARESANGQTSLMFAAWENRADVIRLLIARGADANLASTALHLNEPLLDEDGNIIPENPGVRRNSGTSSFMGGMTALHFAARDGRLEAVQSLVESGAHVNRRSADGSTPMVIAIANGHYAVGKYLLDSRGDPNIANIDGLTPLYATVNMRHAPVSWAPNPPTEQEPVDSLDLMRSLLKKGANPNARIYRKLWFSPTSHDTGWVDSAGATPFWRAAQSSDLEAMRILVAGGANPNLTSRDGVTPLMVAAGVGWIGNFHQNAPGSWLSAVEYCLELGNDVNAADVRGYTALHGAAALGNNEMVRLLAGRGARVDALSRSGDSPADMAFGPSRFFIPKPGTVELLVRMGAPFRNNCRSDQCVDGKFFGPSNTKP